MGILTSNKELSVSKIECGDMFNVTLSLGAEPNIAENPKDIVLVLDNSGSMVGTPLENLKLGAKKFVDVVSKSTCGEENEISNGSRIGIVTFASTATQSISLTTSVETLNSAIDSMVSGGSTNHIEAFTAATQMFSGSQNEKIIVMFTDGITTLGASATTITDAAKAEGIEIYCIGLSGNTGIDALTLGTWASTPSSDYVFTTTNDTELETLFANVACTISEVGAKDIVIVDTVSSCFRIVSVENASKGKAYILDDNNIKWEIETLGASEKENATLEFTVEHIGNCTGEVTVNTQITYSDSEGNEVTFPSPKIEVVCDDGSSYNENCPDMVDVTVGSCTDSVEYDAGDLYMDSLGRILQIDVLLKNICPNRRVALAVAVTELDANGNEYKRGLKTLVIPAHTARSCHDVSVRCIKFVLPELLDETGTPSSMCNERKFRARFTANYIDFDFDCCKTIK